MSLDPGLFLKTAMRATSDAWSVGTTAMIRHVLGNFQNPGGHFGRPGRADNGEKERGNERTVFELFEVFELRESDNRGE